MRRSGLSEEEIEQEFEEEYDEDEYDDDNYEDEDEELTAESPNQVLVTQQDTQTTQSAPPQTIKPTLASAEITRLSIEAGRLGVMQAIIPSQQGASGWYVDVSGDIQYWNVGADGSWSRGA